VRGFGVREVSGGFCGVIVCDTEDCDTEEFGDIVVYTFPANRETREEAMKDAESMLKYVGGDARPDTREA
jgi:hypothetical protein